MLYYGIVWNNNNIYTQSQHW